jgi:hypothetical protein
MSRSFKDKKIIHQYADRLITFIGNFALIRLSSVAICT